MATDRTPAMPAATVLLEQLADAVYLLDPETSDIVWCNRPAWETLGLTPDAVLHHSVLSLQMDVTGAPQWSEIAAVIRSTPCYTFVGRHRHAAGHEVAVEVNTTRFLDQGREYFLSVARDITRRVALEADLKKRENQLWFALNEAMDGLWDWDIATGAVFFSPQLKRMLGYGPDEMAPVLETWSGNVHPEDAARVQAAMQEHLQGRRSRYEAEYRLRNRNGNWRWVMDRGRICERDAAGQPTRMVGMVQDVTAEREAREALRRSEEEQRTLIAALPDVIMRFDRQGRHLYVSENVSTLAPLQPAEIVGRTHRELGFPPDLCDYWDQAIHEVFHTGQAHESEFGMAGPDGQPRTIGWRVVPDIDPATGVRSVLAVCRDVTERQRAEAELARHRGRLEELVAERTAALSEAKAAAEDASRAKTRFLAHMSHELRTPMGAIIGMADLARERTQDPVVREQLGKVRQASLHLLNLINDILDLSKIEAGRMVLEQVPFRFDTVFDSLLHLAGHRAQEKGLALTLEADDTLTALPLRGDPLRLKQILLNLVDNAIKFTARGEVTVRLRGAARDGGLQLRLEVADSGVGIEPAARERLFLPFEQADNSTTRRYGGTGLGLAISRQLVQMMGGDIGVDSEPGRGSSFWFTLALPRADGDGLDAEPAPALPARALLKRHHGDRTALVADDDPVSREIATELLRQAGLQVHQAVDGEEAATMAAVRPYALVLMDMQMPRVNGLDATRRIRAAGASRSAAIVALTANAFEEDRERCLAAGMDAHLTKPIDADHLYEVVAPLLQARPGR